VFVPDIDMQGALVEKIALEVHLQRCDFMHMDVVGVLGENLISEILL